MKISARDYKFVPVNPDPNFSEERNKQVIKETIDWTDRMTEKKKKEFNEGLGERTDAVARFIQRVKSGVGDSNVQSYFGKKMLEHLSGREARTMDNLTVVDQYGRVTRKMGDMYGKKE